MDLYTVINMRGTQRLKGVKTERLTLAENVRCPFCSHKRVWNKKREKINYECCNCKMTW